MKCRPQPTAVQTKQWRERLVGQLASWCFEASQEKQTALKTCWQKQTYRQARTDEDRNRHTGRLGQTKTETDIQAGSDRRRQRQTHSLGTITTGCFRNWSAAPVYIQVIRWGIHRAVDPTVGWCIRPPLDRPTCRFPEKRKIPKHYDIGQQQTKNV